MQIIKISYSRSGSSQRAKIVEISIVKEVMLPFLTREIPMALAILPAPMNPKLKFNIVLVAIKTRVTESKMKTLK